MLYLLSLPFLSPLFEKCFPRVSGVCLYREFSGHSCPLCGMTRGVGAVLRGDFQRAVSLHPLSIFAVLFIFSEVIFRVVLLCLHLSRRSWSLLVRADVFVHLLLAGIFICYIGMFLSKRFFT
ncbi:MAG: DUF2752 domain-containing protein [Planctomycetota bacterium]